MSEQDLTPDQLEQLLTQLLELVGGQVLLRHRGSSSCVDSGNNRRYSSVDPVGSENFGPVNYIQDKAEARASHLRAPEPTGLEQIPPVTRWGGPCAALFGWADAQRGGMLHQR